MKKTRINIINESARFFEEILRYHTMDKKGVPAETCLACAAWMTGTQLFRIEIDQDIEMPRGALILSEAVNNRLPELFAFFSELSSGKAADELCIGPFPAVGSALIPTRLSMAQAQDLLDPVYLSYAKRYALTPEELLQAAVRATVIMAEKSCSVLGSSLTIHIAHYCILEASKTVARRPERGDISFSHLKQFASLLPRQSVWRLMARWLDS